MTSARPGSTQDQLSLAQSAAVGSRQHPADYLTVYITVLWVSSSFSPTLTITPISRMRRGKVAMTSDADQMAMTCAGAGELRRPNARCSCLLAGQQSYEAPMRSRAVDPTTDPAVSSGTEPALVRQRRRHNGWLISMREIRTLFNPDRSRADESGHSFGSLSSRRESTSSRSCSKKVSNDHKHYPRTTLVQQWYTYQIGPALFLGLEPSTHRNSSLYQGYEHGNFTSAWSRLMTQTDLQ